jgi:hypothetical protein
LRWINVWEQWIKGMLRFPHQEDRTPCAFASSSNKKYLPQAKNTCPGWEQRKRTGDKTVVNLKGSLVCP